MEQRDLYYFEVIAELGHMGKAAERVFRTQPALSRSVQRLEAELGAKLFERIGRRIRLTPTGERLLEKAAELRRHREEAVQEIRNYANGSLGHLKIGSPPTMAAYLVPQMTAALMQIAPDMTMELSIGSSDTLTGKLRDGRLDILLTPVRTLGDDIRTVPIVEDEVIVAASANHPLFQTQYTIRDLARYRWLLLRKAGYMRSWLTDVLAANECPPPRVQIEVDIAGYMKRLIHQTELLCFFSRRNILQQREELLREVAVPELTMRRVFCLAYSKDRYLPPIAERLAELLQSRGPEFLYA